MLPVSAISDSANKIRSLLFNEIVDLDEKNIKIGHPKETFREIESGNQNGENHLNLFFYDIKFDGYPADGLSEDPFYVRLYCLITALSSATETQVDSTTVTLSAGEMDLRLIGEVMRVLHEQPILSVNSGDNIAQLQIIPHSLDLDNLNHIWSTQDGTAYRLSVAYEMSLAPIPLARAVQQSPVVGDPQFVVWGAMRRPAHKEQEGLISLKPGVEFLEIDTVREDWMPHISFVEQINASNKELHYVFKVEGDLTNELNILIAGKENAKLKLVWNVWRRKTDHSVVSWKEDIADNVEPKEKEIKNAPGSTEPFFPNRIDPDNIDTRRVVNAKLPDDVNLADNKTWQAVLYAVYEWKHEDPKDSGNMVTTSIKSNPILFYGAKASA